MPYEQERASRIGHVPAVLSPAIVEAMQRWDYPLTAAEPRQITSRLVALDDLPKDQRPDPSFTIAFDGSNQEVRARAEYPTEFAAPP